MPLMPSVALKIRSFRKSVGTFPVDQVPELAFPRLRVKAGLASCGEMGCFGQLNERIWKVVYTANWGII